MTYPPNPETLPIFSTVEQACHLAAHHGHMRTDLILATVVGGMGTKAMIDHIHTQHPHVTLWYDVGDHQGYALEAIKIGITHIIYKGQNPALLAIAKHHNVMILGSQSG